MTSDVLANFDAVSRAVRQAERDAGRPPGSVPLVAVSKTHGAERILPVLQAGHRTFGENRVQEAHTKWPALKQAFPDVALHLIGPLQTNKAREAVALFDVIETIDRPKVAHALAAEMARQNRRLPVFVQVNTGREPQKAGAPPEETEALVAECRALGLMVQGLMCIPPHGESPAPHFAFLRELARRCGVESLSMGMTEDFPIAVEMGATHVRVGTAIFGDRPVMNLGRPSV